MPEQRVNNDALQECGYNNPDCTLTQLLLDRRGLKEVPVRTYQPRPGNGVTFGSHEVLIDGHRVHRNSLYVPGITQFTFDAPMNMMPVLHVYTTDALKTQAIADLKQGMRAILTRRCSEAQTLLNNINGFLDTL